MPDTISLNYKIDGDDFAFAGAASSDVKNKLKQLGYPSETIRRVAIAMYEGEINMVIHAKGGVADVLINQSGVTVILADKGPGIADVEKAMQEGFSTAADDIRSLGFGAGMGLPNMKKYSDKLDVSSELGVGTTVTMYFKN